MHSLTPLLRPALRHWACALTLPLLAAPCAALTETDGQWHGSASIGGSASSGNTNTSALNLQADASKSSEVDEITLQAALNHATDKTDGVRTRSAELLRGRGRYDFNLSQELFAFGGAEAETNRPGGIDRRLGVNGGAGWRLRNDDQVSWNLFGGLGYTDARFTDGSRRHGPELVLGQESEHKLSAVSSFKQRLAFYPGSREVGQRLSFDASLATAITGGWTFNSTLALRWASKVAPGLSRSDRLLSFGFGYKY
jgi:putative salt-induced outer membrane protein